MKVVAMVPIKMNSERIPGKNIKKFGDGTPLIECLLSTLVKVKEFDEIYVYCSSEEIEEYLIPGVKYLKRSSELDQDNKNCNDIIKSFMNDIDADIYVVSHVTGPFTTIKSISECINAVANDGYDSAFMAGKMQEFLWSEGKPLNFDPNHFPRTQDLKAIYSEAPGAYVFKKETFQKYNRRVGVKPYICEATDIECIDIDYPEDFEIANAIYMNIVKKSR
jgi:CMP-N-acetylneuraminic acid synthetase